MRVKITFNYEWLLERKNDEVYPVDYLKQLIMNNLEAIKAAKSDVSMLLLTADDCSLSSEAELKNEISELINEEYGLTSEDPKYTIDIVEADDEKEEEHRAVVGSRDADASAERGRKALDKINDMVGADEFKTLAGEIFKAAEGLRKNKLTDVFAERTYVISADKGSGLTQCLELFAELVGALGLFKPGRSLTVIEEKISAPASQDENANFRLKLEEMFKSYQGNHIICLDISDWIEKLSDPDFHALLCCVEQWCGRHIFFFRLPYVEVDVLKNVELAVNDMLCVRALSISPFDNEQLKRLAENRLSERGFTLSPEAWDVFGTRIAAEKNDGKFYGINTVKKVVADILYLKQVSNAERGADNTEISADDIRPLVDGIFSDERSGLEQLNDLIGADEVRDQLLEIVSQIEYARRDPTFNPPCIHMRFVGNPGTGKTTVARILGKILKEKGILRNGNFFEVFSRDLCGRYIGETAPKTAAKCRDAYGSVLFIDEAYALYNQSSGRDYGREAIDTLIAQMENHRSELVVIMAGYPEKMETLMESNQGLRSRMPYIIKFPNYTREQLADIFMQMAKDMEYDEAFGNAVKEYFNGISDETLDSKEFSNARFVRNLYERTWGKAVMRCRVEGGNPNVLTVEDFTAASADNELIKITERKRRRVGF